MTASRESHQGKTMVKHRDVNLDFDRENRTGIAEAIFCEGKSRSQLHHICDTMLARGKPMLFTRLAETQYQQLDAVASGAIDYDPISRTALYLAPTQTREVALAVVTGGSSDTPVAREAVRTLNFYGYQALEVQDVGVAGLWRVTARLDDLRACRIIICVAGMEAALPTVLAGLLPAVLIAVPRSVGYGVAAGGEAALRSLLVSCAPGLTVTNIDNGYGAACAALRILNNYSATSYKT